jgi:tetratricopeptide (TPR) repeat protein
MSSQTGFPTREVRRLLGLTEARLRYWVRSGFVKPGRGPGNQLRFRFQDLVLLRTTQALVDSGLPIRRVRRALDHLRRTLPEGRALTELKIVAVGGEVVVEEGGLAWEPDSGQRVLILDVADMARSAAPLAAAVSAEAHRRAGELDAEDWYQLGIDLEATSPQEAAAAYEQAIELAPSFAGPYLNLGRLRHESGDLTAAEGLYRRALRHCAPDATAAFNLGVALEDGGRWREAAAAYRQAIVLDAGYADAYYNLASVSEQLGDRALALQNLQAYRRLIRG